MNSKRSVALVGRPNVGKSRLFNSLAGRRIAIVHEQPGVTRDVNTFEVDNNYTLMDTGGIGLATQTVLNQDDLLSAVEEQVFFAIKAAEVIFLVVDGREGCMPLDIIIAEKLRQYGKKPLLVVNKIDSPDLEERTREFSCLGFSPAVPVSAEHSRGIGDLREHIEAMLGPKPPDVETDLERRIKICFIGRPNVGKSSLCNGLLKSERLVVHEAPGTTRDSVALDLDYEAPNGEQWHFQLVDTAGLRKSGKIDTPVEYFSSVRSHASLANADVVFQVIDAREGVSRQDKVLAGETVKAGKAMALVVNKWDYALETFESEPLSGYEDEAEFRAGFAQAANRNLFFLPDSPMLFVSALTGYALNELLATAHKLDARAGLQLSTSRINRLISRLFENREPRRIQGKRFKVYYAVQTGIRPIRIRLFCNQMTRLEESYRRYLQKAFITEFGLHGCPVNFELVSKHSLKRRTNPCPR